MRFRTSTWLARLASALVLAIAVLCAPVGSSAYHEAASTGHAELADDHHGHSHDFDEPADGGGAPADFEDHHKHNPADHSHDKAGDVARFETSTLHQKRMAFVIPDEAVPPGLIFGRERPPRPSDIA